MGHERIPDRAEPDQKRLALSAAIAEAKRSPFHVGAFREAGIAGASRYRPQESEPQEEISFDGPAVGATFVVAGVSHLISAFVLWHCLDDRSVPHGSGCYLPPLISLLAVTIPAGASGVGFGKALLASTVGVAGGIGALIGTLALSSQISSGVPGFIAAGVMGGLVHGGITVGILRR